MIHDEAEDGPVQKWAPSLGISSENETQTGARAARDCLLKSSGDEQLLVVSSSTSTGHQDEFGQGPRDSEIRQGASSLLSPCKTQPSLKMQGNVTHYLMLINNVLIIF